MVRDCLAFRSVSTAMENEEYASALDMSKFREKDLIVMIKELHALPSLTT